MINDLAKAECLIQHNVSIMHNPRKCRILKGILFALVLSGQAIVSRCDFIATTSEDAHDGRVNEFPDDYCSVLIESESCTESNDFPVRINCRRSCGLCSGAGSNVEESDVDMDLLTLQNQQQPFENDEMNADEIGNDDNGLDGGNCEDKLPDCSKYLSMCCSMKDAMNASCPKTCRFCTETPSAGIAPGAPGGSGGVGGPAPTGSSNQDLCGSTNPPSVTVDAPGQTTTTTTLAPVTGPTAGTLPSVG